MRRRAHSRGLAGGRGSALESIVVPGFCGSPSICLWTDRQGGQVLGSDDWGLPVPPPLFQDTWVRQGLALVEGEAWDWGQLFPGPLRSFSAPPAPRPVFLQRGDFQAIIFVLPLVSASGPALAWTTTHLWLTPTFPRNLCLPRSPLSEGQGKGDSPWCWQQGWWSRLSHRADQGA